MLTYAYFGTNDLARAIAFYNAALAPLGMQRCVTGDPEWDRTSAGWGTYEEGGLRELAFWIGLPFNQQSATTGNGSMIAFRARSWLEVDDSMPPLWLMVGVAMVLRASGCITTRTSMPPMCVTRTATSLLPSAVVSRSGLHRSATHSLARYKIKGAPASALDPVSW